MSFLDNGYLGNGDPGLGGIKVGKVAGAVTGAVRNVGRSIASTAQPVFRPLGRAALKTGQQFGGAIKKAALDTSKEVGKGLTQATLATGTALKQAGIVATGGLKLSARAIASVVAKGGKVANVDDGPFALEQQPYASLGWTLYANPGVPGEPVLGDGEANPAWPGYYATRGSEMSIRGTASAVEKDILSRPAPALDDSGTQSTWEGWSFWMIPATPGDMSSADWPGFYAQKAGAKTNLGTAAAVMKDVQAREVTNMPDQPLPPGETNPYLGWELWWKPSEGDAGIYGKKNGVETIHGTADLVATDIQNREKASQPPEPEPAPAPAPTPELSPEPSPTPSGGTEQYSGRDYLGWQIWNASVPASAEAPPGAITAAVMRDYVFGVQGSTRTQRYPRAGIQQLYVDIQNREQANQPPEQPAPYLPAPYQPAPSQPVPRPPAPSQPVPRPPAPSQPAPTTGGGGSFTPTGASFNPMITGGGYREGGFLAPDDGMPAGFDERGVEASSGPDEAAEGSSAADEAAVEFDPQTSELDEGAPRSFSEAVDGLGASPSLPSAILPLAGVALLWYLFTRK
jgi:hypothetical protein